MNARDDLDDLGFGQSGLFFKTALPSFYDTKVAEEQKSVYDNAQARGYSYSMFPNTGARTAVKAGSVLKKI
jgi:hypothetical protein